jgi:hypothetical protein
MGLLLPRKPSATSEKSQRVKKTRGVLLGLRATLRHRLLCHWLLWELMPTERVRELPTSARVMGSELTPAADLWPPAAVHSFQSVVHALVGSGGLIQQVQSSLHRLGPVRMRSVARLLESGLLSRLSARVAAAKDSAD